MAHAAHERQERLRNMFVEMKRERWNVLREEIFRQLGEDNARQFDIALDGGDASVVDLLEDAGLSISSIRLGELTAMEEVERKIEQGTYGICDGCGEEIPEKRLRVMPFALFCVACKEREEGPVYPPPGATL
jgi:DnaK suppressor protein